MPFYINKTFNVYKSLLLAMMCCFSNVSTAFSETQASVRYNSPVDATEQELAKVLKSSGVVEDVVAFINQKIALSEPLRFIIGGDEGAAV